MDQSAPPSATLFSEDRGIWLKEIEEQSQVIAKAIKINEICMQMRAALDRGNKHKIEQLSLWQDEVHRRLSAFLYEFPST